MTQLLLRSASFLFAISAPLFAQKSEQRWVPEITAPEIEAHVRMLASDEMQGRATGSPESESAAKYLASVFAAYHLEPAGDEHGYLQRVALVRRALRSKPVLTLEALTLQFGKDFDCPVQALDLKDARIVTVHTAKDVPEKDDPKLVLFVDENNFQRRKKLLADNGHPAGRGFAALLAPGSPSARTNFDDSLRPGRVELAKPLDGAPSIKIHGDFLERLRKGEFAKLSLKVDVTDEEPRGFNVAAILRGAGTKADPKLAEEALVLTAHYDHLGIVHKPLKLAEGEIEDVIFNGADDDASGCAAVLELAGALAAGPKPARTILFVLVTGEEIGLLGTDYYLDHPLWPLSKTVANLNFEMIGRPDPLVGGAGKQWLTGFELTNLGPAWVEAGIAIAVDPRPDQHFFERSDNIAFVRREIVGQTFSTFNLHKDYHGVKDEADRLDYVHMQACVQAELEAVKLVASGALTPKWTEGHSPLTTR